MEPGVVKVLVLYYENQIMSRFSGLQWIVAPVLQRFVASTLRILFGLLLLGKMSFVVTDYFPHMT